MVLYNSSNLTILSTSYDFVVNRSYQTTSSYNIFSTQNLFKQHLLHNTYSAIAHFFVHMLIIIPGVIINRKFLNNARNEERKEKGKTLQRIMKNLSMAQMVLWPIILLSQWFTRVEFSLKILSLNPCFMYYGGLMTTFMYHSFRLYVGFNSLVVAICRFCFLVNDNIVLKYGIHKFRIIVYYGSILVPLGVSILQEGVVPRQGWMIFNTNSGCTRYHFNDTNMESQSIIYAFVQHNFSFYIIKGIEVICYTTVFIILSNVIEGILYWYTWSFIKQ